MTSMPHSMVISEETRVISHSRVAYETYRILQFIFVVAPIVAGVDKFFSLLANWQQYLSPPMRQMLHGHTGSFMMAVGLVEIVAGIGVAVKPKVFGWVVAAWLCGIVVNLVMTGIYYDIALRDLGLAVAAVALARLALFFDRGVVGGLMTVKD